MLNRSPRSGSYLSTARANPSIPSWTASSRLGLSHEPSYICDKYFLFVDRLLFEVDESDDDDEPLALAVLNEFLIHCFAMDVTNLTFRLMSISRAYAPSSNIETSSDRPPGMLSVVTTSDSDNSLRGMCSSGV